MNRGPAARSSHANTRLPGCQGSGIVAAAQVQPNAAAVREFLKTNLQVFSLRSADKGAKGLITGYFEPIYKGSLERTDTTTVPI